MKFAFLTYKQPVLWCLLAVAACIGGRADAVMYTFDAVTNNTAANVLIAEAQVSMSVTSPAAGQVTFTFFNTGADDNSITDIFFDDADTPLLTTTVSFAYVGTVEYGTIQGNSNLPGASNASPPFVRSQGFDPEPPPTNNGVDPGDELAMTFNLTGGTTFADVIAALGDGSLRVGVHVQSIGTNNQSESLVNIAPEPASAMLLAAGALMFVRRR